MGNGDSPTLFTMDDTTGEYVEYEPPESPAFHETLPEDIRESEHLKEVEDGVQLAKYYVDLKSNQVLPPESPDGYAFETPDGYDLDTETFDAFKKVAHETGISQKQFDAMMKIEVDRFSKARQTMEDTINNNQAEAERELKSEWGEGYDQKLESAKQLLNHEKLVDDGFKQFLEDTRFGDNPQVIRFFAKLADAISEDSFRQPGKGDLPSGPKIGEDGRPMLKFPSMEGKSS